MKKYRYELHCHTSEASACSGISAAELVDLYASLGYSGICITDHFTGNCVYPEKIPWKEKVNFFCSAYEKAKEEGSKKGLDVFFGWEYTAVPGIDFLVYGLDKNWLLNNEYIQDMHFTQYLDTVKHSGGFIAQAHPFRQGGHIPMIGLAPDRIEAAEIYNANRKDPENERAKWYADTFGLLEIAGSDTHSKAQRNFACMTSDRKLTGIQDMIKSIRAKELGIEKIFI